MTDQIALYSAVDDALTHYEVDIGKAALTKRGSIKLPAKVQYAWPHPSRKHLYVSTSNGGPRVNSDYNHVTALAISHDGSLNPLGEPKSLPKRAVHLCVDPAGQYTLNGHNFPASSITVHAIKTDGTIGSEIEQRSTLDYGIYPHQIMVFPSGRAALLVDRGNKAQGENPEQPGALRSFGFKDGMLSPDQVIAPNGGYGFGPRHVVFHPFMPWVYVSDERSNQLYLFRTLDDRLEDKPAYTRKTLAEPHNERPRQLAGAIQIHPSGRFIYVANRADQIVELDGQKVFGGGENNIAVYSLDPATGEPTLIQHAETHSVHVRTFSCEPSGRLLVAASIKSHAALEGKRVTSIPAALSVFHIQENGQLQFMRKYDIETSGGRLQYWMGMVRPG
jgi:6-phosphogluconolactonase